MNAKLQMSKPYMTVIVILKIARLKPSTALVNKTITFTRSTPKSKSQTTHATKQEATPIHIIINVIIEN